MLPFAKAAYAKEIGWRFFPAECVHTDFRLRQPSSHARLDDYIAQGEETRPLLNDVGQKLAQHLGGTFFLGPDKTREQALASLYYKRTIVSPGFEEGDAYQLLDFRRGCLLVEDNHALIKARKKIHAIVDHDQNPFAHVIDRYSRPPRAAPLRGIFIYVAMPNEEIAEIQIHTRPYWEDFFKTHEKYEVHRAYRAQRNMHEIDPYRAQINWSSGQEHVPLAPEWNDEARAASRRARSARKDALEQVARDTGAEKLELADKNYEGDCSYPLRPAVVNGQKGFMVANTRLDELIKEDYPHWDPTWHPSQGKREPYPK